MKLKLSKHIQQQVVFNKAYKLHCWYSVPLSVKMATTRVKLRLTTYGRPKVVRKGLLRCLCHYPPKHHHLEFVKTFPELPGTEPGPKTCFSVWDSLLLPNTLNTKRRGFCFFYSSLFLPVTEFSFALYFTNPFPHLTPILDLYPDSCESFALLWKTISFPIVPVPYKTTIISKITNS